MTKDKIPEPHELANKPLVEAIFELRWALQSDQHSGMERDPGFRILLGRYYERMRKEYPKLRDLPLSEIPEELTAHAVRHQFWAGEGIWPVTQIGPGIVTVNETEGYKWQEFRARIMRAVEAVFDSYPSDIADLKPIRAELRYIDALPFDPEEDDVLEYLEESLHTKISVDPNLFDDSEKSTKPVGFHISLTFPLSQPKGVGSFSFSRGTRSEQPAIIWSTMVRSLGQDTPGRPEDVQEWLNAAHEITDKWFFVLARGPLMSIFEGNDAQHDS